MSANTTTARSIVSQFLGLIFQDIVRGREFTHDLLTPTSGLLFSKIRELKVEPSKIVLETGSFKITVKVEVEEKKNAQI